ncbi:MAG TPA: DUF3159 domain-containing protein [Actinomycetes bacterium]|nr:DUF3159 domain-containing protein [Actinomycetes bacterium]
MATTDATWRNRARRPAAGPPDDDAAAPEESAAQPAAERDTSPAPSPPEIGHDTVEAVVRTQLSNALGGKRGMLEAALPTLGFVYTYLVTDQLRPALIVGGTAAGVLLVLRLVQRQTPQFVLNSLFGFAIAAAFVLRTGRAEDLFLPGMIYNAVVATLLVLSIVVRWPFIGLLIGSVTGDLSAWRRDPAVVRLCTKLTWLFVLPNLIRLAVQVPFYLAGNLAALAAAKIVLGWPLAVAAFGAMLWVLARGRTPLKPTPSTVD